MNDMNMGSTQNNTLNSPPDMSDSKRVGEDITDEIFKSLMGELKVDLDGLLLKNHKITKEEGIIIFIH